MEKVRQVKCMINDVGRILGEMKVFSCRVMGMNVKRRLDEEVAVPTVLCGAGTWSGADYLHVIIGFV